MGLDQLLLQIAGLLMLSGLQTGWAPALSVAYVVAAQGIAGIAKDLTKTASKPAIKATSQQGAGQLFKWVAWFTGSKNAMKGAGFFVGGILLELAGFRGALWLMATLLALVLSGVALSLPRTLGKSRAGGTGTPRGLTPDPGEANIGADVDAIGGVGRRQQ